MREKNMCAHTRYTFQELVTQGWPGSQISVGQVPQACQVSQPESDIPLKTLMHYEKSIKHLQINGKYCTYLFAWTVW